MKKIILTMAVVLTAAFANAQDKNAAKGGDSEAGFKVGVNVGLPMGDIKDAYSFPPMSLNSLLAA